MLEWLRALDVLGVQIWTLETRNIHCASRRSERRRGCSLIVRDGVAVVADRWSIEVLRQQVQSVTGRRVPKERFTDLIVHGLVAEHQFVDEVRTMFDRENV